MESFLKWGGIYHNKINKQTTKYKKNKAEKASVEGHTISNKGFQVGHTKKVTFEQTCEGGKRASHVVFYGKRLPGRGSSLWEDPEM